MKNFFKEIVESVIGGIMIACFLVGVVVVGSAMANIAIDHFYPLTTDQVSIGYTPLPDGTLPMRNLSLREQIQYDTAELSELQQTIATFDPKTCSTVYMPHENVHLTFSSMGSVFLVVGPSGIIASSTFDIQENFSQTGLYVMNGVKNITMTHSTLDVASTSVGFSWYQWRGSIKPL